MMLIPCWYVSHEFDYVSSFYLKKLFIKRQKRTCWIRRNSAHFLTVFLSNHHSIKRFLSEDFLFSFLTFFYHRSDVLQHGTLSRKEKKSHIKFVFLTMKFITYSYSSASVQPSNLYFQLFLCIIFSHNTSYFLMVRFKGKRCSSRFHLERV